MQNKKKIKALVTGSSGFIGSHLITSLIKKGWEVYALIREETNTYWLKQQKVILVKGEYWDKTALNKAVVGMDYIFHLGAVLNAPDWETYYKVNKEGTENLLDACAQKCSDLKKFVYVSSIAASGPSKKDYLKKESDQNHPVSLYGKSKLAAEGSVKVYSTRFPVVIIRPPNVLGTGQKELESVLKLVKLRVLPQLGNGDKQTSICFVKDVVRALILAAEKKEAIGQTYFITDNFQYSWREMIYSIARSLGVTPWVIKIPYPLLYFIALLSPWVSKIFRASLLVNPKYIKSARMYYWIYNSEKIEKELGFSPSVKFEDGIEEITSRFLTKKV